MHWFIEYVDRHKAESAIIAVLLAWVLKDIIPAVLRVLGKAVSWIAGRLSKGVADRNFERDYRKAIIEENRFVQVRGIKQRAPVPIELEDIYIDLRLQFPATCRIAPPEELPRPELEERRRLLEERERREHVMDTGAALRAHKRLVVLGDPGSGKSTLIQQLALTFARREAQKALGISEDLLPLVVRLRDVRPPDEAGGDKRYRPIVKLLEDACEAWGLIRASGFFEKRLKHGKCIVLLDGLDEVADERERAAVADWVERTVAACKDNRYLVTSRIVGYQSAPLSRGFPESRVEGFSKDDIKRFANASCTAVEVSAGDDPAEGRRRGEKTAADLIAAVEKNDRVAALAVNPLMLRIIAILHGNMVELPKRRAQLYDDCIDLLLGRWDTAKGLAGELDSVQKRAILTPIAFRLHEEGVREIPRSQMEGMIADGLAKAGKDPQGAHDFLDDVRERSGLFEERGLDRWGFTHHTFQEYLAALALVERVDAVEFLVSRRFHPWWCEVILLFAGLKDPSPLVKRLLAEKDDIFKTSLFLAGMCIADAASVDPQLREEATKRMEALYWEGEFRVICASALRVLAVLKDKGVLERTLARVESEDRDVRSSAAEALGNIGGESALEYLVPLVKDEEDLVKWSAAYALGSIGGEKALESLIPLLKDEDRFVRGSAAYALRGMGGEEAFARIIPLLTDEASQVRETAAYALGSIGGEKALESLIPLLKDEASSVRESAAEALGNIGGEKALESLIPLLTDGDSEVRGSAAEALGNIGGEKALESVIPLLKDEDDWARGSAAQALGNIGGEKAMERVIPLLKDEASSVRGRAAEALGNIGGEKALETVIPLLKDQNHFVRMTAAEALGNIGGEKALDSVIPLLTDEHCLVRRRAAEALGNIGGGKALKSLIPLLKDGDSEVRWSAAEALKQICAREGLVIYEDGQVERSEIPT